MKPALRLAFVPLTLLWLGSAALTAPAPGVFRGVLVRHDDAQVNWIYVQAITGLMRRVEVSTAQVVYSDAIPAKDRAPVPRNSLKEGTEVRVTATPDGEDWKADRVEILSLHAKPVDVPRLSDRSPVHIAEPPPLI